MSSAITTFEELEYSSHRKHDLEGEESKVDAGRPLTWKRLCMSESDLFSGLIDSPESQAQAALDFFSATRAIKQLQSVRMLSRKDPT